MLSLVPAVVGIPGGIELIIIFFVMFLLFGVPVALALILGYRYVKGQAGEDVKEERIAELEAELAELRDAVENNSTTRRQTDSTTTGSTGRSVDSPVDSSTDHGVSDDE